MRRGRRCAAAVAAAAVAVLTALGTSTGASAGVPAPPAPGPAALRPPAGALLAATFRPASPAPTRAPPGTSPVWAPAASAALRPGVLMTTAGGGSCTADFVFAAGGRTFLGQAAHCGGTGGETETDGCTSATVPVGTSVRIDGADGRSRYGTLAYSSWVTMQANREADPDTCAYNDFALVALDASDVGDVNPSMPFFGGPTGLHTRGLAAGDPVFGYGNARGHLGVAGLRPKVGTSAGDAGGGRAHHVYTVSPGIPGDSGSAYESADGAAVGLLSTLDLTPPVSSGVIDLAAALAYADTKGGVGHIELVPGTEPFTDTPAGVAPRDLATPAGPPLGS